jgi:hypothetical protein
MKFTDLDGKIYRNPTCKITMTGKKNTGKTCSEICRCSHTAIDDFPALTMRLALGKP